MLDVLAQLCGSTLHGMTEARHWRAGVRDDTDSGLIDIWMHFDGHPALHVTGHPDAGGSLVEHDEPYESYDVGQYGEFRVEPVRPEGLLAVVLGHRLVGAALIGSDADGPRTGVCLRFDHRDLVIAQWHDDFVLALDAVPAGLADLFAIGPWRLPSGSRRP